MKSMLISQNSYTNSKIGYLYISKVVPIAYVQIVLTLILYWSLESEWNVYLHFLLLFSPTLRDDSSPSPGPLKAHHHSWVYSMLAWERVSQVKRDLSPCQMSNSRKSWCKREVGENASSPTGPFYVTASLVSWSLGSGKTKYHKISNTILGENTKSAGHQGRRKMTRFELWAPCKSCAIIVWSSSWGHYNDANVASTLNGWTLLLS